MFLSILRLWGIRVPLAALLTYHFAMGPVGIWYAMFVSNISVALLGFFILRRGRWLRTLDLEVGSLEVKA